MALSFPNKESTDPAAKQVGQLQWTWEHDRLCNTVFPDLSLVIKNLTISSEVHEEGSLGGDKEAKKCKSSCSRADFCLW